MRITKFVILVLIIFFLFSVFFVNQPWFTNYLNRNDCKNFQLNFLTANPDLVLVGSSRIIAAVSIDQLENQLSTNSFTAYNIGRPGFDTSRSLKQVQDLFERGWRPTFLVVEIDLDLILKKYDDSEKYTSSKFLESIATIHSSVYEVFVNIKTLASLIKEFFLFKEKVVYRADLKTCAPLNYQKISLEMQKRNEKLHNKEMRKQINIYGDLDKAEYNVNSNWTLSSQAAVELDLVNQIRILAKKNNTKIYFTRVWRIYDPPLADLSKQFILGLIPEFLFAPDKLVRESWSKFMDYTHLSYDGQASYTDWLSNQLKFYSHK